VQQLRPQLNNQLTRFKRIGLFDSGVGGLSVLRRLAELPESASRSFVYLGDTARCPYGNRSAEEIALFVGQIVKWLQRLEVEAIVMACNTSAAMARTAADNIATVPVFDLIEPTAEAVAELRGRLGVMATASTVRSRAFSNAIAAKNSKADVIEYGCPDLVPFVESGRIETEECNAVLSRYVERLRADAVETVILGCTHFPFLRRSLERLSENHITFVDPAQILSGTTGAERPPEYRCDLYVTGDPASFTRAAQICQGDMPFHSKHIAIEELEACHSGGAFAIPAESIAPSGATPVVQ
jgi:glutamate racemase